MDRVQQYVFRTISIQYMTYLKEEMFKCLPDNLNVDLDDIAIIHKEHEIYGIVPRHNGWITIRKDDNGKYNYDLFIAPSY